LLATFFLHASDNFWSLLFGWGGGVLSQLLDNHIKNELIENSQLVHALTSFEESKSPSSEPRKSASIACGASVFEVSMKVPTWASQVMLSHILPIYSYSKKKKKKKVKFLL
jgi:hypothetical protein